ncbi:MAG: hypothetical protein K5876_07710 [Ruminiclostridium sp.]|nr:hypothetical protein [Ruminiclostridium sp.]
MKNTQLYPFERNKYFYGKLLSVEDFNFEQKYMNDKRRLVNRLVHGIGVVCGLNVVRVDDVTISVESGLAFDTTGREIVVDMPVTKKLSMLNGYDTALSSGSNAYVYLCLEYSEGDKGSAHNIVPDSGKRDADRIKEGYNLYLTSSEPEDNLECADSLFEEAVTVFRSGSIHIRHVMPRFANPDGKFIFRVEIETFSKQFAAFSYDIQLVCLNSAADGSSVIKVNFDETLLDKTGRYTLDFELTAANVTNTEGTATPDPQTFRLAYDKNPAEGTITGRSSVHITDEDVYDAFVKNTYDHSMDTELRNTVGQRLYLARIGLVNSVGSSIIDDIENVPFGQYVASNTLLSAIGRNTLRYGAGEHALPAAGSAAVAQAAGGRNTEIASGICRINLNSGSLKNKVFYSEEIFHGLGLGSVTITLGAVTESGTIYGNPSVFRDEEAPYEVAAKLDPSKGSFIIGVLTKSTTLQDYIDVKWTAFHDVDEKVAEKSSMKITIKPNSLIIKPRETKYLEAVCSNMTNKTVRWSVSPSTGGEIDSNGMYSAPNTEGVYEVIAQSAVYPEVKASIMVVVRG